MSKVDVWWSACGSYAQNWLKEIVIFSAPPPALTQVFLLFFQEARERREEEEEVIAEREARVFRYEEGIELKKWKS